MIRTVLATTVTFGLALALAVPAQAQLLGGGLGGGLTGGLGGFGGMIHGTGTMPLGDIAGDADVGGAVRHSRHAVTPQVHADGAVKAPKLPTAALTTQVTHVAGEVRPGRVVGAVTVPTVVAPNVTHLVVVPPIPDLAVRREAFIESGIAPVTYDEVDTYIDHQYEGLQHDLAGTGVEVSRRGQQIVLEMPSDVTFAFNKYDIQPRFYGVLDSVAHTLSHYPATYVDVDGHTDAIGSYAYNQVLSERRAGTVADYLSAHAVSPARMHVEGFGKTEPIASNATISGRAANRRVEIVLTPYVS